MCTQHKDFAHLSQEQRLRLETLKGEQMTLRDMERSTGIHVSVISREFKRNSQDDGSYCGKEAHEQSIARRLLSRYGTRKIENDPALALLIETTLRGTHPERGDWSPDVVANTVAKGMVSHTTIYLWIKHARKDLRHLLPQRGCRRMRYGSKKAFVAKCRANMPSIELRPMEVESREEIGHLEGDTVILKEGRLHTLVERKSRYLFVDFIEQLGMGLAMQVAASTVRMLSPLPLSHRQTITYDRGSEFAWWDEMESGLDGTKIYFAHPHRPWERGTNERSNGLIRRYFPKGQKFASLSADDVAQVVWMINHRPRRILRWRTPCVVFGKCCTSGLN